MRIIRRDSYAIDLDRIVDHIALDNPSAALDVWDDIERQVERLRDFPRSGRTGRMPETRELVVSGTPYIVVYLVSDCWFPRGTEPVFPPRSEPPLSMVF